MDLEYGGFNIPGYWRGEVREMALVFHLDVKCLRCETFYLYPETLFIN